MKKIALAVGLIALVSAVPALAGQGDKIIRFGGAYVSPTGDYVEEIDSDGVVGDLTIEADSAFGGFFGFEYMFTDLFGLDATLLYANHDIDGTLDVDSDGVPFYEKATLAEVSNMPLFISGHFHFMQDGPVDLYAGPTLAYVMYGDLEFKPIADEEEDIPLEDDFGFGAVFGVDVPFGTDNNWMFNSKIRYIRTGAETDEVDSVTVDIDPWIIEIGVGVKF
jgi:outer membrane protein W